MTQPVRAPDGWTVPEGWSADRVGRCRSCEAAVLWCTTPAGKPSPVNPDGVSHFATCPDAESWRKRERRNGDLPAPAPVNGEALSPFQACPVCGSASTMRLVDGWNDGRPVAIVGCGNPWHYVTPDGRSLGDPAPAPLLRPDVDELRPFWPDKDNPLACEQLAQAIAVVGHNIPGVRTTVSTARAILWRLESVR